MWYEPDEDRDPDDQYLADEYGLIDMAADIIDGGIRFDPAPELVQRLQGGTMDITPDNCIVIPDNASSDTIAYLEEVKRAFGIFLERAKTYGSFLNHNKKYFESGLNIKADRALRDMEYRLPINSDTLVDMANYCIMAAAIKEMDVPQ
jgi:hypothetical protein